MTSLLLLKISAVTKPTDLLHLLPQLLRRIKLPEKPNKPFLLLLQQTLFAATLVVLKTTAATWPTLT